MKHSKTSAPLKRCYSRINVGALQEAAEHVDWVPLAPEPMLEERWLDIKTGPFRMNDKLAPFKQEQCAKTYLAEATARERSRPVGSCKTPYLVLDCLSAIGRIFEVCFIVNLE
ncbi:unnamed protein product [Echinostoma caproni]|uniref:Transposase n=1 Tax=Echinostoma caproni TaxID=27848 RepID=A0A183BH10_9TREM|nr:unnamed protein product [Echinostoma caproni]